MAGIDPRKVLDCLYDDSDWNNSDEEEESDSEEENNGVDSFLDYIEEYEVLLLCSKGNSTLLKLFLMLGSAQKESASFVKVRSTS